MLCLPTGKGRHPAAVLVHGSGPHDEDETIGANKPFRDLAWGLASKGIVVLRYEKRTHRYPTATAPDGWTLEMETMDDALAAVSILRKRAEVDPNRVLIIGHSQGAFCAPFIAHKDGKLGGLVMMAGNARSILDLIVEQTEYLAGLDGSINEQEAKQISEIKAAAETILKGKLTGEAKALSPASWFLQVHNLDPLKAASELKIPILILQGGRDYQVTRKDYDLWQNNLGSHKNATLKFYEDLNHLFMTGKGRSGPQDYDVPGHIDPRVISDIVAWIRP